MSRAGAKGIYSDPGAPGRGLSQASGDQDYPEPAQKYRCSDVSFRDHKTSLPRLLSVERIEGKSYGDVLRTTPDQGGSIPLRETKQDERRYTVTERPVPTSQNSPQTRKAMSCSCHADGMGDLSRVQSGRRPGYDGDDGMMRRR